MSVDLQLITAPVMPVEKFTVKGEALQMRDRALEQAALIGKVENAAQNDQCVNAKKSIKSLLSLFESERKKLKEPLLEAGRQLDRVVNDERLELEKEMGRLENLEKDFIRAEQRRVAEEQELQRRELARIESEKQAELKRIADQQAEVERKAREEREREQVAREAAARLASEATNKKQREAAAAALAEVNRQAEANRIAEAAAAESARQQSQLFTERAEAAAYTEGRPVEITRAKGQAVRKVWVIDQINDFQLMKARPDLVRKIEWDIQGLKQALADGQKLPGVTAHEDIGVTTRGARSLEAISV